jgi:hypothetical protein
MEFKMFTAGSVKYGRMDPEKKKYPMGNTNVNF